MENCGNRLLESTLIGKHWYFQLIGIDKSWAIKWPSWHGTGQNKNINWMVISLRSCRSPIIDTQKRWVHFKSCSMQLTISWIEVLISINSRHESKRRRRNLMWKIKVKEVCLLLSRSCQEVKVLQSAQQARIKLGTHQVLKTTTKRFCLEPAPKSSTLRTWTQAKQFTSRPRVAVSCPQLSARSATRIMNT